MTVSVEPLHCGTLTAGLSMFEDGGGADPITIPVPSWLVRHPAGTVVFDTGMHADLTGPSDKTDQVSLFFAVELGDDETVAARLRARQIDPAEVDVVVLSHLHFDHAGGLAQLPGARVVVQRAEWEVGADDELAASSAYDPTEYRLGHDVVTVEGEHDVFGDGRVVCVPTPGHTAGHQSLRVRTDSADVVLAADCAYFSRTIDGGPLPPFGFDREEQARSVARLRALRDAGATVVPGHDPDWWATAPDRL